MHSDHGSVLPLKPWKNVPFIMRSQMNEDTVINIAYL